MLILTMEKTSWNAQVCGLKNKDDFGKSKFEVKTVWNWQNAYNIVWD